MFTIIIIDIIIIYYNLVDDTLINFNPIKKN